jgi:DNA ligase 1
MLGSVLYAAIAETSKQLVETASRKKKIEWLAKLLRELAPDEHAITARHLSGEVAYKLGIGYATVGELRGQVAPAASASLVVTEVDRRFAAIAELRGPGSGNAKKAAFGAMLAAATAPEQAFLSALVIGELRQGALDALVVDAIAAAADLAARAVRAAYMLAGDIGVVAAAALTDGAAGLARFGLTVFRPVLPMLAQTADTAGEALASFGGPAALEL